MKRTHTAYAELLGRISEADAQAEPAAEQLFIEPSGAYPKTIIRTTVTVDGFTLDIMLNDTSITEAVALLKRRGASPPTAAVAAPAPEPRRKPAPHPKPTYQALWLELD